VMGVVKACTGCRSHVQPPDRVLPENSLAIEIFRVCRSQWLTGFAGAYALDGNFVWRVMDDMRIADKTAVWARVDSLAKMYLAEIGKTKKKK